MKNNQCETVLLRELRPQNLPNITLRELTYVLGDGVLSHPDMRVRGVSVDSQDIIPGEIFVAIGGAKTHGAKYARNAQEAGACVIVTDAAGKDLAIEMGVTVPIITVANPREVTGQLAAAVYDHPDRKLKTFAVTGTNGKTTTTYMLRSILEEAGYKTGLVGTVEIKVGDKRVDSEHTTMEAPITYRILALAVEKGLDAVIVETSSHAMSLHRVAGLTFDTVGFVNLQHEHLDFHHDMEGYYQAKAKLFTPDFASQAVICVDDEWGRRLSEETRIPHLAVSSTDVDANLRAVLVSGVRNSKWEQFTVIDNRQQTEANPSVYEFSSVYPGRFNIQNAMVATGIAVANGIDFETIAKALKHGQQVPGRMQKVFIEDTDLPMVIVDFAHTAEAIESVLKTARELTAGNIHIVFSCEGERDASKRPDMGRVAATYADYVWLTDENPRFEDPILIRNQIMEGITAIRPDLERVTEVTTCRRDAVRDAILQADNDDIVMVTGKGPEKYQLVYDVYHEYSDVQVAEETLRALHKRKSSK